MTTLPSASNEGEMTTAALLPNQVWFLDTLHDAMISPGRWTLARIYRLSPEVSEHAAKAAVTSVWKHHDSLRARFRRVGSDWQQEIGEPDTPAPFRSADLSNIRAADRGALISQLAHDVAASISVTGDSMIRFLFVTSGPDGAPRLILAAHHLILDAFSLRVVAADLGTALTSLSKAIPVRLPRGARYAECAATLRDFAARELAHELGYWAALPWHRVARPPTEARAVNAVRLWQTTTVQLSPGVPTYNAGQSGTGGTAFAAVGAALTEWTGGDTWVTSVHHGRDLVARDGRPILPPRAWRTVGWFATGGLRLLPRYRGQSLDDYTRSLGAEPPNHGIGLSLMHWLKTVPGAEEMTNTIMADSRVLFNYFPPHPQATPATIQEAPEQAKTYSDLLEPRPDISVRVRHANHALTLYWDFDPTAHPSDVIGRMTSRAASLLGNPPPSP